MVKCKCKEPEAKGEGSTERKEKEEEQPRQEQCTYCSWLQLRAMTTAAVLYCYGIMGMQWIATPHSVPHTSVLSWPLITPPFHSD